MNLEELKKELLKNENFKSGYYSHDLGFFISEMIIEARARKGLTQKALARLVGTAQPSIARLENGSHLPSLSFLERIAKKLNTRLIPPYFAFLDDGSGFMPHAQSTKVVDFKDKLEVTTPPPQYRCKQVFSSGTSAPNNMYQEESQSISIYA